MKNVGANSKGGKITSFANVTNFFCTSITIGGGGNGIRFEDVKCGIGAENAKGGVIGVKDGGGGIVVKDGGRNANGGGGREGGGEDGKGRGHENGMVQMTLPLGTYENTRGTIGVCFIPLGFSIKASNLVPYTMQKRMV